MILLAVVIRQVDHSVVTLLFQRHPRYFGGFQIDAEATAKQQFGEAKQDQLSESCSRGKKEKGEDQFLAPAG